MAAVIGPCPSLDKLLAAIGKHAGHDVTEFVIVARMDSPVMIYTGQFANDAILEAVTDWIDDADVEIKSGPLPSVTVEAGLCVG